MWGMKRNLAKIGALGALGLAVLSTTNLSGVDNRRYENQHDVKFSSDRDFMEGKISLMPTLDYANTLGLSRLQVIGNRYDLVEGDALQTVTYEPVVRFFSQEVVDSPARRQAAKDLTVLIPGAEHGWGEFALRWDSNVIGNGNYNDVLTISADEGRRYAEIWDKGRDGIVNRVDLYQKGISGNFERIQTFDFDSTSGNEQQTMTYDKDRLLDVLERSHLECGVSYCFRNG